MFPLHPETPEEGRSLEELFNASTTLIAEMVAGLKNTADSLGLPFGERHMTYNSRMAQELGMWAETKGAGHRYHMTLFKAYFVDGINIGKLDLLLELVEIAGLDPTEGLRIIESKSFSDAVDADWHLARQKRVQAVPSFIMGDQVLVGAQSYQSLQQLMRDNGLSPRSGDGGIVSFPTS